MSNKPGKNFKEKIMNNRIFMAVLSLMAAVLLWTYVTSMEGEVVKTFYNIEVVFSGEETLRTAKDLIILDVEPKVVSNITLSGKRTTIMSLSSSDLKAIVDVSAVSSKGYRQISFSIQPNTATTKVSRSDFRVTNQAVQSISFYVDELASKMIEVKGNFAGSVAPGFTNPDPITLTPDSVRISGANKDIERISYGLVTITRENVDRTISSDLNYVLMDENDNEVPMDNIELETDVVNFKMPVLMTKEVELTLEYIEGAGAKSDNVKVEFEQGRSKIEIAGPQDILKDINSITLTPTLDLTAFASTFEGSFKPNLPNEVRNLSGFGEVSAKVEITGLVTKKFTVSNIEIINVPDGYSASAVTKNLDVTVRGPKAVLDILTDANIRAVVDIEDMETAGNTTHKATIAIDGFSETGAVYDNYVVVVALEAKPG